MCAWPTERALTKIVRDKDVGGSGRGNGGFLAEVQLSQPQYSCVSLLGCKKQQRLWVFHFPFFVASNTVCIHRRPYLWCCSQLTERKSLASAENRILNMAVWNWNRAKHDFHKNQEVGPIYAKSPPCLVVYKRFRFCPLLLDESLRCTIRAHAEWRPYVLARECRWFSPMPQ